VRREIGVALALVAWPALLQLALHPLLSGGSFGTWAGFWAYTTFGVLVPGTLLALRTLPWRMDGLVWLGVGWTLGHAIELVGVLVGRQLGDARLGLVWIGVVYAVELFARWSGRARRGQVLPVPSLARCALALVPLVTLGAVVHFAVSLPEISTAPPFVSDDWFHVGNAHEFRDHAPMQDPRLAGEPFNYHVYAYAASAAASLATGAPIADVLLRHSGMAFVFLLILNLFNLGRTFRGGGVVAGAIGVLLVIFPIELGVWLAPSLVFGSGIALYGIYLSTTTLAAQVFLSALLIGLREVLRSRSWGGLWLLLLLAFAGSGSKAMFGPIVGCAAAGAAGWRTLVDRRLDRRLVLLAVALVIAAIPPMLPLLFGEDSYAQSIQWVFAEFARHQSYFPVLVGWGLPAWLAAAVWLPVFAAPILLGAAFASGRLARGGEATDYVVFAWMSLVAAVVPGLGTQLLGSSQLFFLYLSMTILASFAGVGWVAFARSRYVWPVVGGAAAFWLAVQIALGFEGRIVLVDPRVSSVWTRLDWWSDAVSDRGRPIHDRLRADEDESPYFRRFSLTPDIRRGLEWARLHLDDDAVFAVNVRHCSVYGALAEARAYLDTTYFSAGSHKAAAEGRPVDLFQDRRLRVASWVRGRPDAIAGLRRAGVTHVFVDRVNGVVAPTSDPLLGRPVYESEDLSIYALGAPR
jgi:hypothetical protein